MIGLALSIGCKAGNRDELVQSLVHLHKEQGDGPPCVECRVYEDTSPGESFLWLQWWRSERQLEDYLKSVHFRSLLGAIKVLGTLESARIIELQDATSVMGAFLADRASIDGIPSKA
jgi:quinol monooxygenase YgiN